MHSFIAYIDESGDDGLTKFREVGGKGGASRWLNITACVVRASNDLEAVSWRDEIRAGIGSKQSSKKSIHFADMNHNQKRFAIQKVSGKPLRFVAAMSNKTLIPADKYAEKNTLYFYITRYVIERLSWFCRDWRPLVREGNGCVKIVFSRRGGMSYPNFQGYLKKHKENHQTTVHWPVIDIEAVEARDHSTRAGLQLADIGASAIAAALEPDVYGNTEGQYLNGISSNIYNRNGNYLSYGLKFLPRITDMQLSQDQADNLVRFR